MTPKLIIHGGAGSLEGKAFAYEEYHHSLKRIIIKTYPVLKKSGARQAVLYAIRLLENDPIFNAGTGSKLQKDGQIRMSAAIMSSEDNKFSGVINVSNIKNPIDVANMLANERYTVLAGLGATEYARLHNIKYYNPMTEHRLREYKEQLIGDSGTVGAVALDGKGVICSATSTGGVGFELPGRVGDSATVAGTYASKSAGVSCTGRGEHIVNQAVAARIVSRVEDGMSLEDSVEKMMRDSDQMRYRFGMIALDRAGHMVVGNTKNVDVLFAKHDGEEVETFLKKT